MLNPSDFVVTRTHEGKRLYWGGVKHKKCGHIRIVNREAENFSDLLATFAVECPNCKAFGGTASWDSIPQRQARKVVVSLLKRGK